MKKEKTPEDLLELLNQEAKEIFKDLQKASKEREGIADLKGASIGSQRLLGGCAEYVNEKEAKEADAAYIELGDGVNIKVNKEGKATVYTDSPFVKEEELEEYKEFLKEKGYTVE